MHAHTLIMSLGIYIYISIYIHLYIYVAQDFKYITCFLHINFWTCGYVKGNVFGEIVEDFTVKYCLQKYRCILIAILVKLRYLEYLVVYIYKVFYVL